MKGERVFNTGRVGIGIQYQRARRVEMDADAQRLQGALLCKGPVVDADRITIAACVLAAAALAIMALAGWI